ncbi:MAG: hypothetical protein KGQ40_13720, partial [Rhodospirillales bacterium]|nr:hypothetical protein [Rhodospirillales bacterium]
MQMTLFGLALLPLCLACAMAPLRLLELVFIAAVFGAAAALVIGPLGLPPGLPPAMLFIGYVVLQYALGARYPGEARVWRLLEPLVVTLVYALATSLILPRIFAGQFDVWPQKVDADYPFPVPLGASSANFTQDMYLLSNATLAILAAVFLTRRGIDFTRLLRAYLLGGVLVVLVCFWQLASRIAGVPYPDTLFYSNPGWVIFPAQSFGVVPRINGPFSEPAALAFYLSGIVFSTAWILLRGHRSRLAAVLLPGAVVAMLLSTSTTGYAVLGAGGAFLLAYALTSAPRPVAGRILAFGVPLVLVGVLGAVALASLDPSFANSVQEVAQATADKGQGQSFAERTTLDLDSLGLLLPSYGLGAGWGSVRSSSLIPGLLANLGVVGVA